MAYKELHHDKWKLLDPTSTHERIIIANVGLSALPFKDDPPSFNANL